MGNIPRLGRKLDTNTYDRFTKEPHPLIIFLLLNLRQGHLRAFIYFEFQDKHMSICFHHAIYPPLRGTYLTMNTYPQVTKKEMNSRMKEVFRIFGI